MSNILEKTPSLVTFVGYKPKPWQMAVHNAMKRSKGTGKMFVVKSKRQLGKSLMCANILLQFGLTYRATTSILVSPTLSQARKIYKDIVNAVGENSAIKKKNETLLEITLINNSQILFKSAEQREALRGYTVTGILILDEAAYLPDTIAELVLPWTTVKNAPVLVVSTPNTKSGLFYGWFVEGLNPTPESKVITIDWNNFDTSEFLPPERVEQYRKIMPKGQFRSEILGEFVDEGSGVFTLLSDTFTSTATIDKDVYIGIDFANGDGGDYTVVSGFNDKGEQCLLQYTNTLTPIQQVEWISNILKQYEKAIKGVTAEKNSMGLAFIDLLRQKNPTININEFVTSNTSKREIIDTMVAAIGEGSMKLINDPEQKKEYLCYQMEITRSGLITYNGYSAHDDIVMANAFAWKTKTSNFGAYTVSVV